MLTFSVTHECYVKCKLLGHPKDHAWLMIGWSVSVLGGSSINNLVRPWTQLKTTDIDISECSPLFASSHSKSLQVLIMALHDMLQTWPKPLGRKRHKLSVCFHSEIFCAKPKEFIGHQTDHPWEDLGSPSGFMGRIWQPYFSSTDIISFQRIVWITWTSMSVVQKGC